MEMLEIRPLTYPAPNGRYSVVQIYAGQPESERVVPPAGEDYAFDRTVWPHRVEVSVSPTGRSVQVWVDGKRVIPAPKNAE